MEQCFILATVFAGGVEAKSHGTGLSPSPNNSATLWPLRLSACSQSDGTPPAVSSRVNRSTRQRGKNRSLTPTKGSLCKSECSQSSNEFKSRPRKNTPAAVISSSSPQHFSRGLCRTTTIGAPESILFGDILFGDIVRGS